MAKGLIIFALLYSSHKIQHFLLVIFYNWSLVNAVKEISNNLYGGRRLN